MKDYIKLIASRLQIADEKIPANVWELSDENEVNKALFELKEVLKNEVDKETSLIAFRGVQFEPITSNIKRRINTRVGQHVDTLQEYLSSLDSYNQRIEQTKRNIRDTEKLIRVEEHKHRKTFENFAKDFESTIKNNHKEGFFTFVGHKPEVYCMYFTTPEIILSTNFPVKAVVNMGKFKIVFNYIDYWFKLQRFEGNKSADGYFHPYADSSGNICYGGSLAFFQSFQTEKKTKEIFQLLKDILTTYRDDTTPHRKLNNFIGKRYCDHCRMELELNETCPDCYCPDCEEETAGDCGCAFWGSDREE
jgi:hypothetical protein